MKLLTKILIAFPILLALLGRIVLKANTALGFYCILFSNLALVLLIVHLMKESKKSSIMYTIILGLGIVQLIGSLAKILDWPFSGFILFVGFSGIILTGLTLISTSREKSTKKILYLQLALGIVVLFQSVLQIRSPSLALNYGGYLNYPAVALSATVLLNRKVQNDGERNVLLLVFIQGSFFIIKHLAELI